MHRGFLLAAALLGLLAVMAAASGCAGLYTLSRAVKRPDVAGEGMGLPLTPLATSTPTLPITMTATVPDPAYGSDGLPFDPYTIDSLPVPLSPGTDASPSAPRPMPNATPAWTPMETEVPLIDGPPPEDELLPPTLAATQI